VTAARTSHRPLLLALALACGAVACGPESAPEGRLAALPPSLRDAGRSVLAEPDAAARLVALRGLFREHPEEALDFLIATLARDPSTNVRERIAVWLGRRTEARAAEALARAVASDPDAGVVLRALDSLHKSRTRAAFEVLDERLRRDDFAPRERARLAAAHDHWAILSRGGLLPGFLREPPPVFAALPMGRPIRVVAFGDFGTGGPLQMRTADAIRREHERRAFDLGLTLGDNVYPEGARSPEDPRWQQYWVRPYAGLGIPFYATLGNHDWGNPDGPAAEVLRRDPASGWHLPATRYTYTAGAAQFFALDTNAMSRAQLDWLATELERSRAAWKVVYGHHPVRSAGAHGDTESLVRDLLPVLAGRADLYLAGHDHDMQHLGPEQGIHYIVAGSGGAAVRPVEEGPRSRFASSTNGFAVLEIDDRELRVRFLSVDLETLYEYALRR
jgi:hypothetical protein